MFPQVVSTPDRDVIVFEVVNDIKSDRNILAVADSPRPDSSDQPKELIVVVSKVPLDLDGYGRRVIRRQDMIMLLSHYTPRWLEAAVSDERGCWMISGKLLYGKTVYDPGKIFPRLRKAVNSVPSSRRVELFARMLDEAKAVPTIFMGRAPSLTPSSQRTLLRDDPALARAIFLLNRCPPRSEASMLDDLLNLKKLPLGIGEITEILRELDRYDLKRFERARKRYETVIQGLESMFEASR